MRKDMFISSNLCNFFSKSYLRKLSSMSYSGLSRVSRVIKWILGTSPRMTPTLTSYSCLTRVSRVFKWILGTSPRMTIKNECPRMTVNLSKVLGMTVVFCLLSTTAHAECTPTLDCASIGYTETSCETTSLKCPFDTSKLFCIPCDSSYKYDCNGDNMTGGVGDACGGKYASCACSGGGEFNNGSCPQSCTVGMIYYSDKSCSSNYDSSKTAIGVVVKDNELVLSQKKSSDMKWSNAYTDTSLTNYTSSTDAKTDFNGKSNTAVIVAAHPSETASNNAAIYCNTYTTAGTSAGDWYLPAAGELYSYVYGNYSAINTAMTAIGWTFGSAYFWSSSEQSNYLAWYVYSYGGTMSGGGKVDGRSVSCFFAIN